MKLLLFNPNQKFGQITFNSQSNTFVGEVSELKLNPKESFALKNVLSDKTIEFDFKNIDYHGFGEDREVAGWNFEAVKGNKFPCKFLLIKR